MVFSVLFILYLFYKHFMLSILKTFLFFGFFVITLYPSEKSFKGEHLLFRDSFYFLGEEKKTQVFLHFEFNQYQVQAPKQTLKADFKGKVFWRDKWFDLQIPPLAIKSMYSSQFPLHSAYDFSWPTKKEEGHFKYHYGIFSLELTYNKLVPIHHFVKDTTEESEVFLANAVLLGKEKKIKGILLYHRIRLKSETKNFYVPSTPPYIKQLGLLCTSSGKTALWIEKSSKDTSLPIIQTLLINRNLSAQVTTSTKPIYTPNQEEESFRALSLGKEEAKLSLEKQNPSALFHQRKYYKLKGTLTTKASKKEKWMGLMLLFQKKDQKKALSPPKGTHPQ